MKGIRASAVALLLCASCVGVGGLSGGTDAPDGGEPGPDGGGQDGGGQDGGGQETGADTSRIGPSPTLFLTRSGNGSGNVTSLDLGIDCGTTCSRVFAQGTRITLTATPLAGSAFIGWTIPCAGAGTCSITMMTTDIRVDAAFGLKVLDVDGNRAYEQTNDATLITRYLFGTTGDALTDMAIGVNPTRSDPGVVLAYLNSIKMQLDVDGNGERDALTDGILISRYMKGERGDLLINGAIAPGATRTTAAQVEAYLKTLTP